MPTPVAQVGAGNVTVASTSLSATLTGSKPSGTADGDLLVAFPFSHKSAGTWSTIPTGWSALGPLETASGTAQVFSKPIPSAAAETATSYSWVNSAGADRGLILIFRVTGADLTSPLDIAGTWITSGTTSIVTPGLTPNYPNSLLLGFWQASNATATPSVVATPGGMTEVGNDSVTPTASSYMEIAQLPLGAAGVATGNKAPGVSPTAASSAGILIAIAGPPQASAALSVSSSLTASASLQAQSSAALSAQTGMTAAPTSTLQASAALVVTSAVTAGFAPKPLNVLLANGTWAPVVQHILRSGSWVS